MALENSQKRLILIIFFLIVIIVSSIISYKKLSEKQLETTSTANQTEEALSQNQAPDFKVTNESGLEVRLSDFRGKPVVINFWASWCPPCKAELPDFNETCLKYGDEVEFMMINLTDGERETLKSARKFITSQGYTFPLYFDTQFEAAAAYQIMSIPQTFFINSDGTINNYRMGMISGQDLEKEIQSILP